jgi:hypothetical protein
VYLEYTNKHMIYLLLGIIIILISIVAALFIIYLLSIKRISDQFKEFITPPKDKNGGILPSPLGRFIDASAVLIGRAITMQLKATFMAGESAAKRAGSAIAGDIAEGLAEQNPLIAGALNMFPKLRKTLRRNPGLVDMALSRFGGGGNGEKPAQSGSQGNDGAYQIK